MDGIGWGAGLTAIYAIIREIGGQIVASRAAAKDDKRKEYELIMKKQDEIIAELKKENAALDAKIILNEQLAAAKFEAISKRQDESFRVQMECEKDKIRLEARVELLTRLSGITLGESKVHEVVKELAQAKETSKRDV